MKIKTIIRGLSWADEFDQLVNAALGEGWQLTKREVIADTQLLAELVQLDPEPEAEPPANPVAALRVLREFCAGRSCGGCPLVRFCTLHLACDEGPADWKASELDELAELEEALNT